MKKRHVYPEALPRDDLPDPLKPWEIRNQRAGVVNLVKKTFAVPLYAWPCSCGHDHSESMRLHEYGHVAFTPADAHRRGADAGLPHDLTNGVEDARLLARLQAAGLDVVAPVCPGIVAHQLNMDLTSGDIGNLMVNFSGAFGSTATREAAREWAESLKDGGKAFLGVYQVMQSATHYLDNLQKMHEPLFQDTIEAARNLLYLQEAMKAVMAAAAAAQAKEEAEGKEEIKTEEYVPSRAPGMSDTGSAGWGPMTIERPPLARPARAMPTRKWTTRDEGVLPSAMHRYSTDGRIFKQARRKPEGLTILVDCSGSMRWDWKDLQELLDRAPATKVALYNGNDHRGALRIVSDKGKKAEKHYITGPLAGNNCVDGPALRWLSQHTGKKLWVSDGEVTGVSSAARSPLLKEAVQIVVANGIMRVDHQQQALEVVTGKRSFKASTKHNAVSREGTF